MTEDLSQHAERIGWTEFERRIDSLVDAMNEDGYTPEILIPSMRGGLVPAVLIAERMDIQDVRPITIERRGG